MLIHTTEPEIIEVDQEERLGFFSSSKGVQIKWQHEDLFVKLNSKAGGYENREDIAEVLVSVFLDYTDINNYVKYKPCFIIENGKKMGMGCYSENFLNKGEMNLTFSRFFKRKGIKLDQKIKYDREIVLQLSDEIKVDLEDYIRKVMYLDSITSNADRHLNNLSIIVDKNGYYREAPIYDNGLSCLMNFFEFSMDEDLGEAVGSVRPREFFKNYEEMCDCFGDKLIQVRYRDFIFSVSPDTKEELRAFEALKTGLKVMEGKTWKDVSI